MRAAKRVLVLAFGAALLHVPAARASTIVFSNLGPGNTYDCCIGLTISGGTSFVGTDFDQGSPFTPGASVALQSLEVALQYISGTNSVDVWLMSDVAGAPGAIHESFTAVNLPSFGSSNNVLAVLTSVLNPVLLAATQYWVIASANGDTWATFNDNVTGDTGLALRANGGAWNVTPNPAGAFRVTGQDVIPEPATIALVAAGLGAFARARRRR